MNLVTVKSFEHAVDAHLLKTQLESEGIECYIFHEHSTTMYPYHNFGNQGIEVKIHAEDTEKVKSLLGIWNQQVFTDNEGKTISCPQCGSNELYRDDQSILGFKDFFRFIFASITAAFGAKRKFIYRCQKCNSIIPPFES